MFRLVRLSPPHGWNAVWWELAIVTIGVLLALGAQQTVESIQLAANKQALRETINHEIGLNLFVYRVRARQFPCSTARVEALRAWLDEARKGEPHSQLRPRAPVGMTPYRSAWENRDADVYNSLPSELRQKYAEFYDELAANSATFSNEEEAWSGLTPYVEPGPLTLADRRAIHSLIVRVSNANRTLAANLPISEKIAQALEIKEIQPDNIPPGYLESIGQCRPVIGPAA